MVQSKPQSPLLHWIAPRTALKGVIAKNPWLPQACSRAVALFADKTLHGPATVLAGVHEAAIDYIAQAPVLVLAAAGKSDLALKEHRHLISERFKVVCSARPRLKDLMRFYGLAPQLRALSGLALRSNHYGLLKALSDIPASRLAQTIPATPDGQIDWLTSIAQWRLLALRLEADVDWIVAWAAANSCHRAEKSVASEIIDFASYNRGSFDLRWSLADAEAASQRWHEEIAIRSFSGNYSSEELNALADYGALPHEIVIDGYNFVALRTRLQIFEEGRAMHHCVATYAEQVFSGRCWLYSIKRQDNRIATLELRKSGGSFALIQIKAHCNRRPSPTATTAASRFLERINVEADRSAATAAAAEQQPRRSSIRRRR